MRKLKDYRLKEILQGQVLVDSFKQVRNDIYLSAYCKLKPKDFPVFISHLKNTLTNKSLVVSIAFERPETISLLVSYAQKYFQDSLLVIADNSHSKKAINEIKKICDDASVPYIKLPKNPTKHANRSHGMSMQWSYENIINVIKPDIFAFIDHDLIPAKPLNIKYLIKEQPFYGVLWKSEKTYAWQLWAGYCIFNYKAVSAYKLNFLYDFSNGLDTGGRNYLKLYQYFNPKKLNFSSNQLAEFKGSISSPNEDNKMQIIDDCWIHMGGAGHLNNFEDRYKIFVEQMTALNQIKNWTVSSNYFSKIINTRE
jgi:hypothetical protein